MGIAASVLTNLEAAHKRLNETKELTLQDYAFIMGNIGSAASGHARLYSLNERKREADFNTTDVGESEYKSKCEKFNSDLQSVRNEEVSLDDSRALLTCLLSDVVNKIVENKTTQDKEEEKKPDKLPSPPNEEEEKPADESETEEDSERQEVTSKDVGDVPAGLVREKQTTQQRIAQQRAEQLKHREQMRAKRANKQEQEPAKEDN